MNDKVVKSVRRVFDVLELFDRERRPLSARAIARQLSFPDSSTVAILRSMQTLGYLSHDIETRCYHPSSRLPQVAEWIVGNIQNETAILSIMNDLHADIDETINLSRQSGDFLKIIHGIESTRLLGIRVRAGSVMPLTAAHTGVVALATYPDAVVESIVRDFQERDYPDARTLSVDNALAAVRQIRKQQLSAGYDVYVEGIAVIAFALRAKAGSRPLIVSVAGPTDRIRNSEKHIIRVAKRAIKKHKAKFAYPA